MNNTDQIKMFLSMFTVQLPTLLVCLVAVVVTLVKWKEASRAALWALIGFGLVLMLCIVMPIAQTTIQQWVLRGQDHIQRVWVFSIMGIASSLLHAAAYALLLVAVFSGRSMPRPTNGPLSSPE